MNEPHIPPLPRILRHRQVLGECLKLLDTKTLAELRRRADEPEVVDGYGTGSAEVAVATSGAETSVERTVTALAGGDADDPDTWEPPTDPTLGQLAELFAGLAEAAGVLLGVVRRRDSVLALEGDRRVRRAPRPGEGICACCERTVTGTANDRLRGGYCDACRMAWERAGRPGADPQEPGNRRARWEAERRASLEAQAS